MMGFMAATISTTLPTNRQGLPLDAEAAGTVLKALSPQEQLRWGMDSFGDHFALITSFGIQSAVLLHMAATLDPALPVIWVDTGYLPPETYRYAEQLTGLLSLNLQVVQAELSPARMEALHGQLWATGDADDLELYHRLRKVEPLDHAFETIGVTCWASGVRSGQTDHRAAMLPLQPVRGRWSLRPLLSWTNRDVYYYLQNNGLPQHPLFEQGYSTVGDWHSSGPDDGSGRSTRFSGLQQECGIHLPGVMGEGI
ncbi:phosphoadenylyl-sulfate reductase [Synechococcus sp. ATX 2A4]|nr:phosphoadenylyl-sulfate reductase [Synechococcus sp. ATX 2A4]